MNQGLRGECEVQRSFVEPTQNLHVDLPWHMRPMLSFADEVDGGQIETEVPKATEPNGAIVLHLGLRRYDVSEQRKGLLHLGRGRVVGHAQVHSHLPRGFCGYIFHHLVRELVVGDGHHAVLQRLDAGGPDADFLNVSVDAVHLDSVPHYEGFVDEDGHPAKNVGHKVLRSHGHGQTTDAHTCQECTHIVTCIGEP